jgi:hypothetical protein
MLDFRYRPGLVYLMTLYDCTFADMYLSGTVYILRRFTKHTYCKTLYSPSS